MAAFNKVILIGNITRDLELRYIASGTAVVQVGLAVNERFKGSDGQQKEKTLFIDVDVWGRSAEVLCEYGGKGRCILIEGTLELDTWDDPQGNKRSRHKVRCDRFHFMDSKGDAVPVGKPPVASQPKADAPIINETPTPPEDGQVDIPF